jgi:DNA-binding beta-propeller fold protein YncE
MTATWRPPRPKEATLPGYPTLFRIGHKYEKTMGAAQLRGGFVGPMDIAIGADGWRYVLNRTPPARINVTPPEPPCRFIRVTIDDEGYEDDIIPAIDIDSNGATTGLLTSMVMCTLDTEGILFATDEHANVVAMFSTSTGETLGRWGEQGDEPGQLNAPSGIELDSDENLWVVSSRSHRVDHFTRSGEHIDGWGEFGSDPGQLNYPWGVTVDPINGTVLVADWRNDRIQRFSPEGELLQIIGHSGSGEGELNRPSGVTVDKYGDIYVADRNNHRVLLFNYRGTFIESFRGDATLSERAIQKVMTSPNMVRIRDNVTNFDREKRLLSPTSVKVDDDGFVYIMDSGRFRVQIYQKMVRVLEPDEVDPPEPYFDPVLT